MINYVFKKLHLILKERPITIEIPNNLPKISLNKILIQEVLKNLIDNAVKFTPKQGRIIVTLNYEKSHTILEITDTGIGISKDEQHLLFKKFA